MSLRRTPRPLAFLAVMALIAASCGGGSGEGRPGRDSVPIVLLITVDGLATDRLAAFGGDAAAPTLEGLMASGLVWLDGWSASPMTRPAVATYLTGVAPDRHGVRDDLFTPLAERWPTLATRLAEAGYRTAAFPDSSFLGSASGVLRGFETVDDPPPVPFGPSRWIPTTRAPSEVADHVGVWLRELPEGARSFAWIHFSGLMRAQFVVPGSAVAEDGPIRERLGKAKGKGAGADQESGAGAGEGGPSESEAAADSAELEKARVRPIDEVDAALASILSALEQHGDLDRALILIAGTSATLGGKDAIGGRGPGFSLDERAIRVPVVARFPAGTPTPRGADQPVWAPDVPATVAAMAGIELAPEAEGVSLLEQAAGDRAIFSWSWATLDQMGWVPLQAVRRGAWKQMTGWGTETIRLDGVDSEPEPSMVDELTQALAERARPEAARFDPAVLGDWMASMKLELDPLPIEGRDFGPAEARRQAARLVWRGRSQTMVHRPRAGLTAYKNALEHDPQNLAAMLDRGQLLWGMQSEDCLPLMREAVRLYPANSEVWHWLAHAVWIDSSWEDAEPVLQAILPFHPDDPDVLYDLACTRSLAGDLEISAQFLDRAVRAGFRQWEHIETDGDLRNLRESPYFSEVMRNYGR